MAALLRAFCAARKPRFRAALRPGDAPGRAPRSAALAQAAALETHDLAPGRAWLDQLLGQLLGDAEQALAPIHLGPDLLGLDARLDPERHQVIDQIGAFLDDRRLVPAHGVYHHLDRLLGKLLGHLV